MHVQLDQYAYLSSPVHRWDPRFKIFSLCLLILGFSFVTSFYILPVVLVTAFGLLFLSGLPVRIMLERLYYPVIFLLFFALLLGISSGGEVYYSIGVISIFTDGLKLGAIIVIRSVAQLLIFFVMFETAPFTRNIQALYALKVPRQLVAIAFFTLRYIFVYWEELRKMKLAAQVRGHKERLNRHNLNMKAGIIGSLLVRSFERAERVNAAMTLRGYSMEKTFSGNFQAQRTDYWKAVIIAGLILVLLWGDKAIL